MIETGDVEGEGMGTRATREQTQVTAALAQAQRKALRAEARREAAKRELDEARDEVQVARTALWRAVREAREGGATFPQIASVLGVSVQRAHALAAKPDEAARR